MLQCRTLQTVHIYFTQCSRVFYERSQYILRTVAMSNVMNCPHIQRYQLSPHFLRTCPWAIRALVVVMVFGIRIRVYSHLWKSSQCNSQLTRLCFVGNCHPILITSALVMVRACDGSGVPFTECLRLWGFPEPNSQQVCACEQFRSMIHSMLMLVGIPKSNSQYVCACEDFRHPIHSTFAHVHTFPHFLVSHFH